MTSIELLFGGINTSGYCLLLDRPSYLPLAAHLPFTSPQIMRSLLRVVLFKVSLLCDDGGGVG